MSLFPQVPGFWPETGSHGHPPLPGSSPALIDSVDPSVDPDVEPPLLGLLGLLGHSLPSRPFGGVGHLLLVVN